MRSILSKLRLIKAAAAAERLNFVATYELFSPVERQSFIQLPETMDERSLARYYLLTPQDLVAVNHHRGRVNRLGFAVQLSYLRFPGRAWEQSEVVPPLVLQYIASQLSLSPKHLAEYARERPIRAANISKSYLPFTVFKPSPPSITRS